MIAGSVFMACYGGGHAAALAPVIARLDWDGMPVQVMAFTTARAALAQKGIAAFGFAEALPLVPSFAAAKEIGARLATGQGRHPLVSAAETEAYLGVGYLALERDHGEHEAARIWQHAGRQAFLPTCFFEELFTRQRPAVVVSTNSPRSERAMLEAARRLDIPSLCLVDLYAAHEIAWCGQPGYASIVCVLNEEVRRRFIACGQSPDRVIATGNPAFDRLGRIDRPAVRTRTRTQLGLCDNDRVILWISQPEPAFHLPSNTTGDPDLPVKIDRNLAEAYRDVPGIYVIVRLHPSEDRPPAASAPHIRYCDRDEPLDDLLCASDCVMTCSSTVGVEAALLGVPVVQVMESMFSADLPLETMGLAVAIPDHRHAVEAIDAVFLRAPGGTAAPSSYRFDATQRVVDAVLSLTRSTGQPDTDR